MNYVCAWCNKEFGEKETALPGQYNVTRGMCEDCSIFLGAESVNNLRKYIEKFEQPVFVVDKDAIVCTSNRSAVVTLNKSLLSIEGMLGGQVIECEHAFEPGGCGRTIHCVACAIRNSITHTYKTGLGVDKVKAYNMIMSPNGPVRTEFVISTEKVNSIILLQIHAMEPVPDYEV